MTNQNRHAYLIVAHSNPYVLEKLVHLLDDPRNDIYIHIDIKSDLDISRFQHLPIHSNITIVKKIDVCWGHVSQIKVELLLYRLASAKEQYAYYHFLSGSDLPIKTQDYIHAFFSKHAGKEFIGFSDALLDKEKIDKIHLFPRKMRVQSTEYLNRLARKLRQTFIQLQRLIHYNRMTEQNIEFKFGSTWVSITHDLVVELLSNEQSFLKLYKYSSCADEIYKQTFVYNSNFRNKIFNETDELEGCQRYMDWKRGTPYTFKCEDYELIKSSKQLFARKFEDNIDYKIADKIVNFLISS